MTDSSQPRTSLSGKTVDGFQIGAPLGQGGMGAVYKAKELSSGRFVAMKVLLEKEHLSFADKEAVLRLRDESLATASVEHHGLVKIIASGEIDSLGPYLVYELIEGGNLHEYLAQSGPLSSDEMVHNLAKPILGALSALHEKGILHRDIKPENILRRKDGSFLLGDLGLAYFEGREAKTKTGLIVGTPGFIAPECLLATTDKPSTAADCYSVAMLFCYAMTGKLPFKVQTPQQLIFAQIKSDVQAKKLIELGIAQSVAKVLAKALKLNPKERTSSAHKLFLELEEGKDRSPTLAPESKANSRISFTYLFVFIALLVIAIAFAIFKPKKAPISSVIVTANCTTINVNWQSATAEPMKVELKNRQGARIFWGQSTFEGGGKHSISIERLSPNTSYQLHLADNKYLQVKTEPIKLLGTPWAAIDGGNLFFSASTNSPNTPMQLTINDSANEKELLWRGRAQVYEKALGNNAPSVNWSLHHQKTTLAQGKLWPLKTVFKSPLWSSHRTTCLNWLKNYLVVGHSERGLGFLTPKPKCTGSEDFWRGRLLPTNVKVNKDYHYFWQKNENKFLCFGFSNGREVSFAEIDLENEPKLVQKPRELKLSGHFASEAPPLKIGNTLLFTGKRDTQIAWAFFDLDKEEFRPLIDIPLGQELPKEYDKKLPWLVSNGFKVKRMRIHGSPIVLGKKVYSLGTMAADELKGLVTVLLSLSLDNLSSPKCWQILAHQKTIAGDQELLVREDDNFIFNGDKEIFSYEKDKLVRLATLPGANSYLASSVISYGSRLVSFAGRLRRDPASKAAVLTTVTIHLATTQKNGELKLHRNPIAYVEVWPGGRLPRVRDLALYENRYLFATMMGNCTVIDLQSGLYKTIAHRRRVETASVAPNGLWAAYLNNSQIIYSQIDLQMSTAKKRAFLIKDLD